MTGTGAGAGLGETIRFGPYELDLVDRALRLGGVPVPLGGRAMDLLILLIDRAGEVVSARELLEKVWPDTLVGKANLRVLMAALRKSLRDGEDGARYIVNYPARGYLFVAPVERRRAPERTPPPEAARPPRMPPLPRRVHGREADIAAVTAQVMAQRFVSIVGSGGNGKTTLAVSVAHGLLREFGEGQVHFVDLGQLDDPADVPRAVADGLGCSIRGADPLASILAHLGARRSLLVVDNCEHLIAAAVALTEALYFGAPSCHLLATSREALRADGETVYRLMPLATPADAALSNGGAGDFPSVQLFWERAAASGFAGASTEESARLVGEICQRLDGVPLAIELVASRVGTYGIAGTAQLLDQGAELSIQGRRSAPERHRSLQDTLDWSYRHLNEEERRMFRRLSVFVGPFTVAAAQAVAGDEATDELAVTRAIAGLVDKCLVWPLAGDGPLEYRLLFTARAYAQHQLELSGEGPEIARRHCLHCIARLTALDVENLPPGEESTAWVGTGLANVRRALEWSFAGEGDADAGVTLAALAAPVLLKQSLLAECRHWCRKALDCLPVHLRCSLRELELQNAFATAALYAGGERAEVEAAIVRALRLAEQLRARRHQLDLFSLHSNFLSRHGEFAAAVEAARSSLEVARAVGTEEEVAAVHFMLGTCHHLDGDQEAALSHCHAGLRRGEPRGEDLRFAGFDMGARRHAALARTRWMSGFPEQARRSAREAIVAMESIRHPVSHTISLLFVLPVLMWTGDLAEAEAQIDLAMAYTARHRLTTYQSVALALKGEIRTLRGDGQSGLAMLTEGLQGMGSTHFHMIRTPTRRAIAEAYALVGREPEALAVIEEEMERVRAGSRSLWVPDLLRTQGDILSAGPHADPARAEEVLLASISLAREQSSLGWELRAATSLARLWAGQGRAAEALELLPPIHGRFAEGHDTLDLRKARQILVQLGASPASHG